MKTEISILEITASVLSILFGILLIINGIKDIHTIDSFEISFFGMIAIFAIMGGGLGFINSVYDHNKAENIIERIRMIIISIFFIIIAGLIIFLFVSLIDNLFNLKII
jgi:hypothetical protein